MKAGKKARKRLEARQADYDGMLALIPVYQQESFKAAYHRPGSIKK